MIAALFFALPGLVLLAWCMAARDIPPATTNSANA